MKIRPKDFSTGSTGITRRFQTNSLHNFDLIELLFLNYTVDNRKKVCKQKGYKKYGRIKL